MEAPRWIYVAFLVSLSLGLCSSYRCLPSEGKEFSIFDQSRNNNNNLRNFNFGRRPYGRDSNCASQALAPDNNIWPYPDDVNCEYPSFVTPIDSPSLPPPYDFCSRCPYEDCRFCLGFGIGELVGRQPKIIKVCPSGDCGVCCLIIGKENTMDAVAMPPVSV